LARWKNGAALRTPASNSASIPGVTSICAISRIMLAPFDDRRTQLSLEFLAARAV
jgi:hypothetical protein